MAKQKSDAPDPKKKKFKTRVHFIDQSGKHIDAVVLRVNNEETGELELSIFPPGGQNTTAKGVLPDPEAKKLGTWHEIEKK